MSSERPSAPGAPALLRATAAAQRRQARVLPRRAAGAPPRRGALGGLPHG